MVYVLFEKRLLFSSCLSVSGRNHYILRNIILMLVFVLRLTWIGSSGQPHDYHSPPSALLKGNFCVTGGQRSDFLLTFLLVQESIAILLWASDPAHGPLGDTHVLGQPSGYNTAWRQYSTSKCHAWLVLLQFNATIAHSSLICYWPWFRPPLPRTCIVNILCPQKLHSKWIVKRH
jgi:hypothetical protein